MGRPAAPIRLLVGLHYLKHAYNESNESDVERFLEKPSWQYFCGCEYFQHQMPIDPTTLVRWRKRIGSVSMEKLLQGTIETAKSRGHVIEKHIERVNVDTTVQEKAITFPTDAHLYHKARRVLARLAKEHGMNCARASSGPGKKPWS